MTDKEYGDIFCVPSANMYLKGKVFRQLRELGQNLSGFSYVSYEHLDKKDILYGRMPKKRNEVVIDKQVIDRMTEKKSAVTLMYSGYKSYIGAKISDSSDSKILRVVGISDTSEPTVYCNQNVLLGFSENSYKLESVDEFKEENVKGYENPSLGDNEVLLRKGFAESEGYEVGDTIEIGDDIETHYTIVGTFPDSLDIDYVFSDKGCENIKCLMVYDNRSCLIYTDNIQKTKKYYKKTGAEQLDVFAPSMTVPHDDEIKKYIEEKVYEILELVGLVREHAGRYPHEFSGGQRQRIGIARSVIMNPEMIIADEPISALDVSIQAQVINLLNELRERLGLTILFIAHDLSVVKYFSDRIGVMYFGKMVELASSDELFAHPLHPYTRSLLSAIPLPDPHYEKKRTRITYNPLAEHDYSVDTPSLREIAPGHFVYCNDAEEKRYKKELNA